MKVQSPLVAQRRTVKAARAFLLDENGSYILETAMAMPVFLAIVFMFIATSLLLFVYGNMTYGAQAAVRYAAVRSSTSLVPCTTIQIQQAALDAMLTSAGGTVQTVAAWSPDNNVGSAIKVSVSVNYPVFLPFINVSSLTLTTSSAGTIIN